MTQNIPLLDLKAQYKSIQPEIDTAVSRVIESGHFILGPEVTNLEREVAAYLGQKHAVGCASGTDALVLALRAYDIGPGDEVIIPAYTFFATAGTVLSVGATPVFVDVYPDTYCINIEQAEKKISARTKAILPVHLYGHPAEMDELLRLADTWGLKIIEDNAQAFGASYRGRKTGAIGHAGCLSFFPSKNLGGYGDGGMVVTGDEQTAERLRMLRTHGWKQKYYPEILGYNSRLDALQAAILRAKLPHVDAWNLGRREVAAWYSEKLQALPVQLPVEIADAYHVYHLYIIRVQNRERVRGALKAAGVATDVYYPQPPYLAEPCSRLGYKPGDFPEADRASLETMALPIYPELENEQLEAVYSALAAALV